MDKDNNRKSDYLLTAINKLELNYIFNYIENNYIYPNELELIFKKYKQEFIINYNNLLLNEDSVEYNIKIKSQFDYLIKLINLENDEVNNMLLEFILNILSIVNVYNAILITNIYIILMNFILKVYKK